MLACKQQSSEFETTIGTPQGDCLSPVLFVICLESALRDLRATLPPRPPADELLPGEVIYADDTDFLSSSRTWLDSISPSINEVLRECHLKVNEEKIEQTTLRREGDRLAEVWRKTHKLGSLQGNEQDVTRRKQLATAAFRSLSVVWCRREFISEKLRLRLYQAFAIPVLTYNGGTWGLTVALEESLDSFHRQHLRSLLGVRWPQKITNVSLYARCKAEPITNILKRLRWQLLVTFFACRRTPQHHWQWWRTMRRPGEDAHVSQLSRSCRKTWRKRIMEGLCHLVTCSASGSWPATVQGGEDSVPSYVPLDWITQNRYI